MEAGASRKNSSVSANRPRSRLILISRETPSRDLFAFQEPTFRPLFRHAMRELTCVLRPTCAVPPRNVKRVTPLGGRWKCENVERISARDARVPRLSRFACRDPLFLVALLLLRIPPKFAEAPSRVSSAPPRRGCRERGGSSARFPRRLPIGEWRVVLNRV